MMQSLQFQFDDKTWGFSTIVNFQLNTGNTQSPSNMYKNSLDINSMAYSHSDSQMDVENYVPSSQSYHQETPVSFNQISSPSNSLFCQEMNQNPNPTSMFQSYNQSLEQRNYQPPTNFEQAAAFNPRVSNNTGDSRQLGMIKEEKSSISKNYLKTICNGFAQACVGKNKNEFPELGELLREMIESDPNGPTQEEVENFISSNLIRNNGCKDLTNKMILELLHNENVDQKSKEIQRITINLFLNFLDDLTFIYWVDNICLGNDQTKSSFKQASNIAEFRKKISTPNYHAKRFV